MSSAAPPRTKLWTIFSSASWRASAAYLVFATFATIRSRRLKKKSPSAASVRSEEHTSELQSHLNLVCRLLLEKKNSKAYRLAGLRVGFMVAHEPVAEAVRQTMLPFTVNSVAQPAAVAPLAAASQPLARADDAV